MCVWECYGVPVVQIFPYYVIIIYILFLLRLRPLALIKNKWCYPKYLMPSAAARLIINMGMRVNGSIEDPIGMIELWLTIRAFEIENHHQHIPDNKESDEREETLDWHWWLCISVVVSFFFINWLLFVLPTTNATSHGFYETEWANKIKFMFIRRLRYGIMCICCFCCFYVFHELI